MIHDKHGETGRPPKKMPPKHQNVEEQSGKITVEGDNSMGDDNDV